MKKLLCFLVAFILSNFFFGCDNAPTDYSELATIDSKIRITQAEELTHSGKPYYLDLVTEKIYPCYNYSIDYVVLRRNNNFNIRLLSIHKPGICLTALGPARSRINLGNLNNGQYNLNIEINGAVESAKLDVTDSNYKISADNGLWLKYENKELRRVPEYIIWGQVGYSSDTLITVVNNFLDSLRTLGAQPRLLTPGDYGYFKIDMFGKIETPGNHGYHFVKMFLYEYRNNIADIESLMKRTQAKYFNQISLSCQTWRGDVIYGW